MMGLPDGRKSFKIGLAVLMQYRRVTYTQPASQPPGCRRQRGWVAGWLAEVETIFTSDVVSAVYRAYYVACKICLNYSRQHKP